MTILIIIAFVIIASNLYVILIRKKFHIYFKSKLKELANFFLDERNNKLPYQIQYNCFESYGHHKKIIDVLKRVICINQGELVEFVYDAGELHKPIKEEIGKKEANINFLIDACEKLESEINRRTTKLYGHTYELVLNYFCDRANNAPRICVKEFKDGYVEDVFRYPLEEYCNRKKISEADKGCQEVIAQGYAHLFNNIPMDIKEGKYDNPRIKTLEVMNYISDKSKFNNWTKCWIDTLTTASDSQRKILSPSDRSCYKSTLIIPMTLLKNEMSDKVREHFKIPGIDGKENSRAIYAILCFDHTQKNYFNEETDIDAGYIFADIFSLYSIYGLMYTKYSKSFNKAKVLIKEYEKKGGVN
ncbi:MAG: hypothetical protein ABIJ59_03550 [Pseudomonadota bacterium]